MVSKYCDAKNGRKAYLALQASNEGEDFQECTIENAFNILNTTFYCGEMQRFNWEKCVNLHQSAHKLLERAKYANSNGMDEETKKLSTSKIILKLMLVLSTLVSSRLLDDKD